MVHADGGPSVGQEAHRGMVASRLRLGLGVRTRRVLLGSTARGEAPRFLQHVVSREARRFARFGG
jgi:hypothetical protein